MPFVTPAYKGYKGFMHRDRESGRYHGRVFGIRSVVTFQGETISEARQAFRDSVDDWLEWNCSEQAPNSEQFSE